VAACERCCGRQRAFEAERAAFYAAAPSFEEHAAHLVRERRRTSFGRRPFVLGGALAALAALAMLAFHPAASDTRSKGGASPSLGFFVQRAGTVFAGEPGMRLHPGDRVRFTYGCREPRYFALFGRDVRTATLYHPAGDRAERVRAGRETGLEFSLELDSVLGEEHIYALFCRDRVALAPLLQALRDSGQLTLPDGCEQASVSWRKVVAP
jgi:hypothetical protein